MISISSGLGPAPVARAGGAIGTWNRSAEGEVGKGAEPNGAPTAAVHLKKLRRLGDMTATPWIETNAGFGSVPRWRPARRPDRGVRAEPSLPGRPTDGHPTGVSPALGAAPRPRRTAGSPIAARVPRWPRAAPGGAQSPLAGARAGRTTQPLARRQRRDGPPSRSTGTVRRALERGPTRGDRGTPPGGDRPPHRVCADSPRLAEADESMMGIGPEASGAGHPISNWCPAVR